MRAALVGTIVATCAAGAAVPAAADVKAGVDAWQQGDFVRAVAAWKPLAAAGDPDAQFNLGQAYKLGRGVAADMPIAIDWFRKAADQGHLRAADNYGLLLFQQGRRDEALPYIRKSADRGEARAQYILGTAMFNGDMVSKDWVTAYALMTRAASSGLQQASSSLATMDKYISTEQRQKGLALAADMGRAKPETDYAAAPVQAPVPAAARPAPAPIPAKAPPRAVASTSVPPSTAAPSPGNAPPSSSYDGRGATYAATEGPPPRGRPPAQPPGAGSTTSNGSWGGSMAHPHGAGTTPSGGAPPGRTPARPVEIAEAPPPREVSPVPRKAIRPPGPPVAAPSATAPPSGNWRIQMGAFREEPRARALWQTASARLSSLAAYKPFLVKGGDVTRLQAGPLRTQNDATRLCGQVRAAGYDCVIKQM